VNPSFLPIYFTTHSNFLTRDLIVFPHVQTITQVSGVADYVDDIPAPQGTLHAAPILATVPHAYLRSVDASGAYALNEDPKGAFGLDDGKVS